MIVQPEGYTSSTMKNHLISKLPIIMMIIAGIMIIALTISIALLFTIGKPTSSQISLAEPCNCGCQAINPIITQRIVNGESAVPNSWPWQLLMVAFTPNGLPYSYCGATLITPKHALTAAHCVFGFSSRNIGVFPRQHIFNISSWSPTMAYTAQRIYLHESYDDAVLNDDVAVIRLNNPIPLDEKVSLICIAPENLQGQELKPGDSLIATGWGLIENLNKTLPKELQQVRLQYVARDHPLCEPLTGTGDNARPGQMCAGFPPKAVCSGDSGGPLIRSIVHPNGKTYWQQVGIMSATVDCGLRTNYSDVYARVDYYHPWILDKIRISS